MDERQRPTVDLSAAGRASAMRILFINTHYFMPQSHGGMSITLDQLCRALAARGHRVSVLAGFRRGGWYGRKTSIAMKIRALAGGRKIARDHPRGYPVWRSWDPVGDIQYVSEQERPDVIVIMGGKVVPAVRAARKTGVPLLTQVHDVEFHFHAGDFSEVVDIPCVANSHFTANVYRDHFGITADVVYPFISPEKYKVSPSREAVAFVNPYLHKGVKVAIAVAQRCSDIPFLFVGIPPAVDETGAPIADVIARLPNVTLLPPQDDMRAVYEKCKILLAPSQWEEAFGRVIIEAQISGIPVVASSRGGLPEAAGDGGILLSASSPVDDWAAAIRRLWTDGELYNTMSARALASASRLEFDPGYQVQAHESAIRAALAGHHEACKQSA
jgi:glycosyltransferase involved in cell wall biosynthesis